MLSSRAKQLEESLSASVGEAFDLVMNRLLQKLADLCALLACEGPAGVMATRASAVD